MSLNKPKSKEITLKVDIPLLQQKSVSQKTFFTKPISMMEIEGLNLDLAGNVIYPIEIGSIKIHNLGRIEWKRKSYHSKRMIYPIGFKSSRKFKSMKNAYTNCEYHSEILDGGERPLFKVTSSEDPDNPIIKESSSSAWLVVC